LGSEVLIIEPTLKGEVIVLSREIDYGNDLK